MFCRKWKNDKLAVPEKRKEAYSPEIPTSAQCSTGTPPTGTTKKQKRGPPGMVVNYKGAIDRLYLVGTTTIDWDTVEALGMKNDLTKLLAQMGLLTFAQRISEMYPEATKEFLWTMELVDTSTIEKCKITFATRGDASQTSFTQICEVFNFEKSDETNITMTAAHRAAWQEMIDCDYSVSKAKETMIRHTVLRFAAPGRHRATAHAHEE